jgi:hypothetical protein
MALLGTAAMLLWFDIVPEHVAEHGEWIAREHFQERLAIPGFIRAQRWVSLSSGTRYLIAYEVADIDVLSSAPYLERLNNPTPWTTRMMPHFRGMVRGFCRLESSSGTVLGATCVSVRYSAAPEMDGQLRSWLDRDLIPRLAGQRGVTSTHGLRSDRIPEMTAEQRIRGRDAGVERVLLATGYSSDLMKALAEAELGADAFEAHGASPGATSDVYQLVCLSAA